ncbi:MAG: ABC transporter substrate-binding protein [Pseudomonadota bacterium]
MHHRSWLFLIALTGPLASAGQVTIVSTENAPFAYTDPRSHEVTGVTTDILDAAFKRSGLAYKVGIYPWARAMMLATSRPDTCVYPVTRLPERESLFQWVGPLNTNRWVLYARGEFRGRIEQAADVAQYAVGGLRDDGPAHYLKSQGVAVELVGDNKLNVRKLAAGHITLWATGLERGRILADEMGVLDIKPVFTLREVDHYLACHRSLPAQLVQDLNGSVAALRENGGIKAIIQRYEARRSP